MKGPDHKSSLTINEFKQMVKLIRDTETILCKEKILSKEEILNSKVVRKSCVSNRDIKREILKRQIYVLKDPSW